MFRRTPSGTSALESAIDVLVVAADPALRQSIVFLLEADGMEVAAFAGPGAALAASLTARCVVIDERDIAASPAAAAPVFRLASHAVLLRDAPRPVLEPEAAVVLTKPLLGPRLIDAIRATMARRDREPGETT